MNSITKRWVRSSLLFIILLMVLAEGVFLYFLYTNYYAGASAAVQGQVDTILQGLNPYISETATERAAALRGVVEEYDEKTRFELMLVDRAGNIVSSSLGYVSPQQTVAEDILGALNPSTGLDNYYVGSNAYGERVMAITATTPFEAEGIVAIRVVTSLTNVDRAILNLVVLSLVLVFVIIFASVLSGVYFIRSIVRPLQKVEATATRIAQGDFDTRIDNDSADEIGRLCRTINHMAEALGRTERMKNDFISSVSHELRTPLTSIKGWAETLGDVRNAEDPVHRRGVEIISGEADRLYDMVEELLDFSRIQNGLTLTTELLDLAAEVEESVLQQGQRAAALGIEILYEAPELPVPVMADKNRVRQVLLNVLDNAIKYSQTDGKIGVEILLDGANAFVVISDEGQGILPEDLEHVKMRFYKGQGSVRGSGIGLAVVDEIMTAHGGSLEITSEAGKGTEVTLRLPLHKMKNLA